MCISLYFPIHLRFFCLFLVDCDAFADAANGYCRQTNHHQSVVGTNFRCRSQETAWNRCDLKWIWRFAWLSKFGLFYQNFSSYFFELHFWTELSLEFTRKYYPLCPWHFISHWLQIESFCEADNTHNRIYALRSSISMIIFWITSWIIRFFSSSFHSHKFQFSFSFVNIFDKFTRTYTVELLEKKRMIFDLLLLLLRCIVHQSVERWYEISLESRIRIHIQSIHIIIFLLSFWLCCRNCSNSILDGDLSAFLFFSFLIFKCWNAWCLHVTGTGNIIASDSVGCTQKYKVLLMLRLSGNEKKRKDSS